MILTEHDHTKSNFLVVGGGPQYVEYFKRLGTVIHIDFWRTEMMFMLDNVDCVVFTGGADVDPQFYNRDRHKRTAPHTERDTAEMLLFKEAAKKYIPCVGICRGAQFLTVMNNGELVQDCTGHALAGTHGVTFKGTGGKANFTCQATSTHHQMMYPYALPDDEYVVIATANKKLSDKYETVKRGKVVDLDLPEEPEVVFYPYTECLCIQGHPETDHVDMNYFRKRVNDLIERLIFRTLNDDDYRTKRPEKSREKYHNVQKYGNVIGG